MHLDRMPNWLKALIVVAAMTCGLPSVASAHAGHQHATHAPDLRQSAFSHSAGNAAHVTVVSAFERLRKGEPGTLGACCCQGIAPSCPSSSSGSPFGGLENRTTWDLAAVMRHSKVDRGPQSTRNYTAPRSLLDRPPKI
jgi:hypothetical protein